MSCLKRRWTNSFISGSFYPNLKFYWSFFQFQLSTKKFRFIYIFSQCQTHNEWKQTFNPTHTAAGQGEVGWLFMIKWQKRTIVSLKYGNNCKILSTLDVIQNFLSYQTILWSLIPLAQCWQISWRGLEGTKIPLHPPLPWQKYLSVDKDNFNWKAAAVQQKLQ